jgi:hypothetical protein
MPISFHLVVEYELQLDFWLGFQYDALKSGTNIKNKQKSGWTFISTA